MLQASFLGTAAAEGSVHVIETLLLYGAGVNDIPDEVMQMTWYTLIKLACHVCRNHVLEM